MTAPPEEPLTVQAQFSAADATRVEGQAPAESPETDPSVGMPISRTLGFPTTRVAAAVAIALVGIVGLTAASRVFIGDRPVPAQPAPLRVADRPLEAKEVKVELRSTPAASVFVGTEPVSRGTTPLTLSFARATAPLQVTLRSAGYQSRTTEVIPDRDSRLELALARDAPPPVVKRVYVSGPKLAGAALAARPMASAAPTRPVPLAALRRPAPVAKPAALVAAKPAAPVAAKPRARKPDSKGADIVHGGTIEPFAN
jgi:hypothetical protein